MIEDLSDLPVEDIKKYRDELRRLILDKPEKAWDLIKSNPLAVISIPRLRQEFKDNSFLSEEKRNIKKFFEEYEDALDSLFSIDVIRDKYGVPFTVELLAEYWRRNNQQTELLDPHDIVLDNLSLLYNQILNDERTAYNKAILSMLIDLNTRIRHLNTHEENQMHKYFDTLRPLIKNFFQSIIEREVLKNESEIEELPNELQALLALTTMSTNGMNIFKQQFSKILLDYLQEIFDDLPEKYKYAVAPYFLHIEQAEEQIKAKKEKEKHKFNTKMEYHE